MLVKSIRYCVIASTQPYSHSNVIFFVNKYALFFKFVIGIGINCLHDRHFPSVSREWPKGSPAVSPQAVQVAEAVQVTSVRVSNAPQLEQRLIALYAATLKIAHSYIIAIFCQHSSAIAVFCAAVRVSHLVLTISTTDFKFVFTTSP